MKWLKSLFIQRFSFMDVVIAGLIYTINLPFIGVIIAIITWSAVVLVIERWLNIRAANGYTPWKDM